MVVAFMETTSTSGRGCLIADMRSSVRWTRYEPANQEHALATDAFGHSPGHEIERALDQSEGHHESREQQEETIGYAELGLGQRRTTVRIMPSVNPTVRTRSS